VKKQGMTRFREFFPFALILRAIFYLIISVSDFCTLAQKSPVALMAWIAGDRLEQSGEGQTWGLDHRSAFA
jgi:hypothetical protein